jgi:hypothetical protein
MANPCPAATVGDHQVTARCQVLGVGCALLRAWQSVSVRVHLTPFRPTEGARGHGCCVTWGNLEPHSRS